VVSERTVEAQVSHVLLKLGIPQSEDGHRRVLAVLAHFSAARAAPLAPALSSSGRISAAAVARRTARLGRTRGELRAPGAGARCLQRGKAQRLAVDLRGT